MFEWPAKSSDLNLFDYKIWNRMKQNIDTQNPRTLDELKLAIGFGSSMISYEAVMRGVRGFSARVDWLGV